MNVKRFAGRPQHKKKPPGEPSRRPPLVLKYSPADNNAVDAVQKIQKSVWFSPVPRVSLQRIGQQAVTSERHSLAADAKAAEDTSTRARASTGNWSRAKWRDKPRE